MKKEKIQGIQRFLRAIVYKAGRIRTGFLGGLLWNGTKLRLGRKQDPMNPRSRILSFFGEAFPLAGAA
jgi:hypothetical protein